MKKIVVFAVLIAGIAWAVSYFSGGKYRGIDGVLDSVTITEVQKWQDEQGNWHFSNSGEIPAGSETIELRSDRNVIKVDYIEQLEAQQSKQLKPELNTDNQPMQTSRITTVQQGIKALQQAGDVQGILDQRADQQEKLLESYR
ncbi:MAG: hypothetical protein KUG72_10035 [Pseudomonadales bacterium]|nr:hypothetical protein [Pseudomonadales bacterium]